MCLCPHTATPTGWFVLVGSEICYYKSEDDAKVGKQPLGSLECAGANLAKGPGHHITISALSRSLKLRAAGTAAQDMWMQALAPHTVTDVTNRDRNSSVLSTASDRHDSVSVDGSELADHGTQALITGWLEKKVRMQTPFE